jgi:hypothetical protein
LHPNGAEASSTVATARHTTQTKNKKLDPRLELGLELERRRARAGLVAPQQQVGPRVAVTRGDGRRGEEIEQQHDVELEALRRADRESERRRRRAEPLEQRRARA